MIDLIDYTSYPDIRAVLGVSTDEIEDSTLGLEVYSLYLDGEFDDINTGLTAQYVTVAALSEGSRTTNQQRFYSSSRLFATYAVARQLTTSLPMFGPKEISDGKAMVSRFTNDPYKATVTEVKAQYDRVKLRLAEAFGVVAASTSTVTALPMLLLSSPDSDPVTGS